MVINWLNGHRSAGLTLDQLDTDGNRQITARDALLVINQLNEPAPLVGKSDRSLAPSPSAWDVDQLFKNMGDDEEDADDTEEPLLDPALPPQMEWDL